MDRLISFGVPLPGDAHRQIEELARATYQSRAAVVRQIILQELAKRKAAAAPEEVAA